MDSKPLSSAVPLDERVPLTQKVAYASGVFADNMTRNAVHQLANPIFQITLGVNPVLIGLVLALTRVWDGFIDPFIGSCSDNARTRFGRRRPFIFVGALLTGIAFPVIFFFPRGMSEHAYVIYFAITAVIFYVCFSIFAVPYDALGMELATSYHERTRVMAVKVFFQPLGGIACFWLYAITQLPFFKDDIQGVRVTAIGVGVVMAAVGIIPALFVRERTRRGFQPKMPIVQGIKTSLTCKPFIFLVFMSMFTIMGVFTVNSLGLYLNIYHVHGGDKATASVLHGWNGTIYHVAMIVAVPFVTMLATRVGKKKALLACISMALVGSLSKWFCYVPGHPYLMFIPVALMGPGLGGYLMLTPSLLADICDFDELDTGLRREATYCAVYNWIFNAGLASSYFISGIVLAVTGFDEKLEGAQNPNTIYAMRVIFTLLPVVVLTAAAWFAMRIPVTEAGMTRVREALRARKVTADAAPTELPV